jgi:hypothetical protein
LAAPQIPLPLGPAMGPRRIVVGGANAAVVEALQAPETWPYRTAIVLAPARAGKSLLAGWFVDAGLGAAVDDAHLADETALFHQWNRAQAEGRALLLTAPVAGWRVALPDLASRLGAALRLEIGVPDDAMFADLILAHAEARALPIGEEGARYLARRAERSHLAAEQLVAAIDRLSLARKAPPGPAIWREALEELGGGAAPGGL